MKKIPLLILLLCTIVLHTNAQKAPGKKLLLVHAGASLPYGDFTEKTFTYEAGFAAPGANIESNFLWYRKWIGLEATVGYANLFFAKNSYLSAYQQILGNEGVTTVQAGNYQTLKCTAGFLLRVVEFGSTEFRIDFQAGMALNVHPEIEVTNSFWGTLNSIPKSSDWQSISSIGLDVSHYLSEKYALVMNVNSNHTHPGFDDAAIWGRSFNLLIRYVNINIGLLIAL